MKQKYLDCGHPRPEPDGITSGYGIDKDGKTHCFKCCALIDRKIMAETGKATLYLSEGKKEEHGDLRDRGGWCVSNWPGSLKFRCSTPKKGRHNIARCRFDVWFQVDHETWHGVQYGDQTQICHCKRIKG